VSVILIGFPPEPLMLWLGLRRLHLGPVADFAELHDLEAVAEPHAVPTRRRVFTLGCVVLMLMTAQAFVAVLS
jgi:hypothetical protein